MFVLLVLVDDCGDVVVPIHGTKMGNSTTYGATLEFKCDVGYQLWGSEVRICQAGGIWSGSQPICLRKIELYIRIASGVFLMCCLGSTNLSSSCSSIEWTSLRRQQCLWINFDICLQCGL